MVILNIIIFASCEPLEKVSDVPEIHFKSYSSFLVDTLDVIIPAGELVLTFIDGDSDIGLQDDALNFFLLPYQKLDGEYDSIDAETYGRKYTIGYDEHLDRSGSTIRGEIKLQIYYFISPPFDTIRYDFYIVDNAGHKSNVESTTDIAF